MALEFTRKPEYELHPAGEWKAQFADWEEDKHEKFGIQAKLSFDTEVLDEEGLRRRINTWTKPSLHPKSKLYKMLQALGINPDDISDEELKRFTLDDYIGQKLRLTIAHEPKKDDPNTLVDRITGFLPYRKATVRTAASFDDPEDAEDEAPAAASNGKKPAAATASAGKKSAKELLAEED